MCPFISDNMLYLNVYFYLLIYINVATPTFFFLLLAWYKFIHLLTFSLPLYIKCISWREHIFGTCFFIYSNNLCLLVGVSGLLTFNVNIDISWFKSFIFLFVIGLIYFLYPFFLLTFFFWYIKFVVIPVLILFSSGYFRKVSNFRVYSNLYFHCFQFSSVAQSCPALCNPMDCSTPGFPVHHQLLDLTQTCL